MIEFKDSKMVCSGRIFTTFMNPNLLLFYADTKMKKPMFSLEFQDSKVREQFDSVLKDIDNNNGMGLDLNFFKLTIENGLSADDKKYFFEAVEFNQKKQVDSDIAWKKQLIENYKTGIRDARERIDFDVKSLTDLQKEIEELEKQKKGFGVAETISFPTARGKVTFLRRKQERGSDC